MKETLAKQYAEAKTRKEGFFATFLFLVWPFLAAISAFKNYNKPWAKNIFWAFCSFYGFVYAVGAESQSMDIVRYIAQYQQLYTVQFTLDGAIRYFQQSEEIDILRTLLAITLSRFSDAPALLTTVYGTIFGFFFSRNLWFILERLEGKISLITVLIVTCFFLVNPIWEITTFRMWTAAHIFIYGIFLFLFDGKKSGFFIASTSLLVHFAFLVPVGLLLGYLVLGNRLTLYFGFYLATLFISEIDIYAFNQFMEAYAPEILQERTSGYRSESYIEELETAPETSNWYAVWYSRALQYAVMGFLIILFVKGRSFIRENMGWNRLFSYTLLLYGVANILSLIPSGGRFQTVGTLSSLALIALYIQNRPQELMMKRFIIFALPLLLLFIIVSVRIGLYSISATAVIGNPVIALFIMGDHLSLNDLLRMII